MKHEPPQHLVEPAAPQQAGVSHAEAETALSTERPWPGMRPYREQDAAFYFGRDAEIEDLLLRTERSLLTLLYARGGLGKTSLVRAGLAPRLVEHGFLPVYLRPRGLLDGGREPIAEAIRAVQAAAEDSGLEATAGFDAPSLWELFHRQNFDLWDATNRLVTPVLVLDQFEEIFQIVDDDPAAAPRVRALLEGIAELVENRLPQRLTADDFDAAPDRRFDIAAKDYRVVLSFREDYLPQVRKLRAIVPSVIENHVRLEPLTGLQALQVVQSAGRELIDAEAAALLVQSVGRPAGLLQRLLDPQAAVAAGGEAMSVEVEPAILSVVCFHLNSERLQRGRATIDVGLVKVKTAQAIFDDYYRVNIGQVDAAAREFVETRLVTPGGERVPYPAREVAAQSPALAAGVNRLLEQGILRKEWFGGEQRLEISHDLLLPPIRRAMQRRVDDAARGKIWRRSLSAAAAVVGVIGLLWYLGAMKLRAEFAQRETIAEALLVAYVPLKASNDDPMEFKEHMAQLIVNVNPLPAGAAGLAQLQALFDSAQSFALATAGIERRRLMEVAIDYVQLKVEAGRFEPADWRPLLLKLKDTVGQSCAQKFLVADDTRVRWFQDRGGIPAECG